MTSSSHNKIERLNVYWSCHVSVDDDGCLTNMMLDTVEYYQYRQVQTADTAHLSLILDFTLLQFSLAMGVVTMLIGLVGVVGNIIR